MKNLHRQQTSHGYQLAQTRLLSMSDDEIRALTNERLVASYGLKPDEAERLLKGFTRRNR